MAKIEIRRIDHILVIRFPNVRTAIKMEEFFKTRSMLKKVGIDPNLLKLF